MEPTQPTQNSEFETCFNLCQYFLLQRNFQECHKYAIKANELDPNHSSPPQIRAISRVLMHSNTVNEHPNYYSVLNLPNYSREQRLMLSNFEHVTSSLNPDVNPYPFAPEAFKVVLRARSVLSSPTEKFRFDEGLRKVEKKRRSGKKRTRFDDGGESSSNPTLMTRFNDGGGSCLDPSQMTRFDDGLNTMEKGGSSSNPTPETHFDANRPRTFLMKTDEKGGNFSDPTQNTRLDTFWTMCPYCYYLYEFLKDYEDCSLRCQNEKCKRVLHALPIAGPPPPPEVLEKGEYVCFGLSVLGTEGKSLWSPFVKNDVYQEVIEISDDEVEEDENGENEEPLGVEGELVKSNDVEMDQGCTSFDFGNVGGEKTNEFSWGDDDDIDMYLQDDFGMGAQDIGSLFS